MIEAGLSRSVQWYSEPKEKVGTCLTGVFRQILQECKWKRDADEYHATLYCGAEGAAGVRQESKFGYRYGPATMAHNVARNASDTLVAKVAKHRPLPQVLANKGDWKAQKRAKKMSQFLEGAFYKTKIFEKWAKLIVRDAAIFRGGGWLKIFRNGKSVRAERCHPWEIYYDDWDARYDEPRNLYHCRTIDKGVAIEELARNDNGKIDKDKRAAIETGGVFDPDMLYRLKGTTTTVDRVDVLETWHLCDNIEAHENEEEHECTGRHVIAVPDAVLVDEPWEESSFPFARLRYSDPLTGGDGGSLVQQLEGFQYSINETSERINEGQRNLGLSIITVPDGSGIYNSQVMTGVRILNHKAGGGLGFFQPNPVHPSAYQWLSSLKQDALNDIGMSQMSAESTKPAGIQSGIALQTLDDIETERFIVFGRAYEAWCLDVSRLLVAAIKQVAELFGEFEVPVPMKQGLLKLTWKEVQLDGYQLRVFPTSLLPQQLSARLEKLKMLWDMQVIDRATFLQQLDAPDLQTELDTETADRLLVDEMIEAMLDAEESEGEAAYRPPSPYIDLKWAAKRAHQRLNRADLDGAPEFNKELLRRFITAAEQMAAPPPAANDVAQVNGPPAPPPGPPMGPPPGPPGGEPMPMPPPMPPPPMPVAA